MWLEQREKSGLGRCCQKGSESGVRPSGRTWKAVIRILASALNEQFGTGRAGYTA